MPHGSSRNRNSVTASSEQLAGSSSNTKEVPISKPADIAIPDTGILEHWLLASIGLGGLIFSLHCFLADSGTLLAYSWTGYPITGPLPGLHGYLTLMAMTLGVFISSSGVKTVVYHPTWMAFGALSAYFMHQWRDWPGYIAGLCLSTFLSSLAPVIIEVASRHGSHTPGKVYFTAWLVVCALDLANVWTVAYAFVPAGWLLRERTDM
jgi:PGAP2IP, second transmembrane domain